MKLLELSEGYAKVSLPLRPEYDNWDQQTHGGLLMSLLDQAFGAALNTGERRYVAVQLSVNFIAPPQGGTTLFAEGRAIHQGKRVGVAQMTVTDSRGKLIATALGTSLGMDSPGSSSA
jgi:acyl-CoA thioesterase